MNESKGDLTLSPDELKDLKSGTISTMRERFPQLIPGFEDGFSMIGEAVHIDPSILGMDGAPRLIRWEDYTEIRTMAEDRSQELWGVKIRTDRESVREVVNLFASKHRIDCSSWLEDLPVWDGFERIHRICEDMGIRPLKNCGHGGNADILSVVGRMLFMRPVMQSRGMKDDSFDSIDIHGTPLLLFVGCGAGDLSRILKPCALGRSIAETTTPVFQESKFAESFNPYAPYLILPEVAVILHTEGKAVPGRFREVLRKSSVFYRIPNMGRHHGEETMLPLMLGTLYDVDDWKTVAEWVPVIPLVLDPSADTLPFDVVQQCYAEALRYVDRGQNVRLRDVAIKTDYGLKTKKAKKAGED